MTDVYAAAEVDEALWTLDERGEQVRRDDVDGQHLSAGEDAGVVDNGVHTTEVVHVAGDRACFLEVGEVADYGRRAAVEEVAHGREAVPVCARIRRRRRGRAR
jgi:hypothetical protein